MGMYDEVRCDIITPDYNLFQTKDIEGDIGGTGSLYYIDPSGLVWYSDYYGTSDWVQDMTPGRKLWPYRRIKTGKHGKVRHMSKMTKYIHIYPTVYEGSWIDVPRYRLHIVNGQLQSHHLITHADRDQRVYGFQF